MTYTFDELRHKYFEKVYDVYEIFKNHFGEAYVDLQGLPADDKLREISDSPAEQNFIEADSLDVIELYCHGAFNPFILVWWPSVIISNEYGKSIRITDLYAKIQVSAEGTIPFENHGFLLNRSSYTYDQFTSNYLHSHIPSIPVSDFSHFQQPCLGTGPIRNTIATLRVEYDEATWMLFCQELDMYVTVESIHGGPYKRLEYVGSYNIDRRYEFTYRFNGPKKFADFGTHFDQLHISELSNEFIKYYLEKGHLSFNYQNGVYVLGMPFIDYVIDISNAFIEWFNENYTDTVDVNRLFSLHTLNKVFIKEGKVYKNGSSLEYMNVEQYQGKHVCTFKGRNITISIERQPENSEAIMTTLLNADFCINILMRILEVINFRYKNDKRRNQGSQETSSTYQKVLYL